VRRQVLAAVEEADLVVFVVDTRVGPTALDIEIARILRRGGRAVLLAANKVDAAAQEGAMADLYRLGFGDPIPVSAEHGRGIAELLEMLRERCPAPAAPASRTETTVHVAVVGRPNVGKSSLVNAMVGAERVLVHAEPGTTRDAVDTTLVYEGRTYVLVDTAGIRRKGRVLEALEKLAVVMALKSLERCQVALVVVDASEGIASQDAHIAGYSNDAGRAAVVVVNKWDLVPGGMVRRAEVVEQIRDRLPFLDYAPVCFTSATKPEERCSEVLDMKIILIMLSQVVTQRFVLVLEAACYLFQWRQRVQQLCKALQLLHQLFFDATSFLELDIKRVLVPRAEADPSLTAGLYPALGLGLT